MKLHRMQPNHMVIRVNLFKIFIYLYIDQIISEMLLVSAKPIWTQDNELSRQQPCSEVS